MVGHVFEIWVLAVAEVRFTVRPPTLQLDILSFGLQNPAATMDMQMDAL
jgi:hypothetical protein